MSLEDQIDDLGPLPAVGQVLRDVCRDRDVVTSRVAGYISVRPAFGHVAAYFNREFIDVAVAAHYSSLVAARLGSDHVIEKSHTTHYVRVDDLAGRAEAVRSEVLRAIDWRDQAPTPPTGSATEVLEEADFVRGMKDGAAAHHLYDWADSLLDAVERCAAQHDLEWRALIDLLRHGIAARRAAIDPFADYLEAPRVIIDAYERHGSALQDLKAVHAATLDAFITDIAQVVFRAMHTLPTWADLVAAGASAVRPAEPEEDW